MHQNEQESTYLIITDFLKAHPAEEGGDRFVYLEASNEAIDAQGEVVLSKALADSADYFLRYGNLDIDHITQIGARGGIADYPLYEIGRPVEVSVQRGRTFVKGQIYRGDGEAARKANLFWDSLTAVSPPQRWYPSVGGAVMAEGTSVVIDPETKAKKKLIGKVRWTNIGFSKTPVNTVVPTVSTMPFGAFAKCWGAGGLDISKALEAGYGTDSAALTGGAALRRQSLHGVPINYWDFRERMSNALLKKRLKEPTAGQLVDHAVAQFGLSHADAADWVARFMGDLTTGLNKRRQQ